MTQVAVDENGQTYAGMGTDLADYDNDGLVDLFVDDLANQKYAMYRNNGDGTFTYVSQKVGVARISQLHSGWGLRFFDYDNDGWKDLAIAQGHDLDNIEKSFPQLRYREPMLLLHNNQGVVRRCFSARREKRSRTHGSDAVSPSAISITMAGLIFVVTTNGGPIHVLHNETQSPNHWLTLNLVGHKSNRDAIGALVKVTTPSGSQYATVTTAVAIFRPATSGCISD